MKQTLLKNNEEEKKGIRNRLQKKRKKNREKHKQLPNFSQIFVEVIKCKRGRLLQARNQEFFRAWEVSENKGTSINI